MKQLSVKLETVTPLFLGGADPRGEPELRAASFRGVLRFWLRALLGGVLGDDSQKIFEQESKVFGSTDHASPVIVRVKGQDKLNTNSFNPLPHRKDVRFHFKGFYSNEPFTLTLLSRDDDALNKATKALELLCLLGGLGRRSRRGFGSLQIVEGDLLPLKASNYDELCLQLKERLKKIVSSNAPVTSIPSFPMLHGSWAQVKVCKNEFNNWEKAIEFVMQKARNYKNPVLGWAGREGRQASPIHVHLAKLADRRKYALVLTTLLSELNPNLKSRATRDKLVDFLDSFEGEVVFGFKEVPEKWPTGNEK